MVKRFSLIVGINNYGEHSALEPLRFAEADATLMAESLGKDCGFDVEVLLGDKASLEGITRALRMHYDTPLELFLFFFAGHGEFLPEVGMHCLHCYGSEAGDTIGTLNLSEWASRIRHNITADSSVMIVDACRSKVYRGSQARGAAPGLDSSVYTALKGVADTRDIRVAPAGRAGVQRVRPMYTLLACSAGQVSYEDAQLGHGVFTHSLVDEIRADGGELSLGQLRRRVGDRTYEWCVARRFSPEQVPEWIEPSLSGEVWLRGKEPQKPAAAVVPPQSAPSVVAVSTSAAAAAPAPAPVVALSDALNAVEAAANPADIPMPEKSATATTPESQPVSGTPHVFRGRLLAALTVGALAIVFSRAAFAVAIRPILEFVIPAYHVPSNQIQALLLFVSPVMSALFFSVVAILFTSRRWFTSFLGAFALVFVFGFLEVPVIRTFGYDAAWLLPLSLICDSATAFWIQNRRVEGFRAADAGMLPLWCYFFDDARLLAAKGMRYRPSVGRQK